MADLIYEAGDGIARITINRPAKLNAMTGAMWAALPELVAQADSDETVRAIVVTGAGDQAFCAGADILQFGEQRGGEADAGRYDGAYLAACASLAHVGKPTVAVIRGICFGGGFGLAMSCDIRLAQDNARFRVPAARLGLGYAYEGVAMLVAKLGHSAVADLMLSARIVDSEEALRAGIISARFSDAAFTSGVEDYLVNLAANAPLTMRAVKLALSELLKPAAARDIAAANTAVAACQVSDDYREGQAAFREKRLPVFTGR
jgi:enoyl-CoA hydratase/carnithine racemase